jgi:UDP-N-acetylmuramoyl-L-alanyl-D-glutamate--2,6-diaminopimelate ligase
MQGAVSARLADISVFTSEDPRNEDPEAIIADIAGGAISAGAVDGSTSFCVTDRREAIHLALTLAQSGDCVLLAGKGHEGSIIWSGEKRWWDEKTVAQQELIALGFNAQRST